MFPTLQTRARDAFEGAIDRAVEFATLGEYRYLTLEPDVANNAPAESRDARRAAATPFTRRGPAFAAGPGTSGSAAGPSPRSRRRSPRRSGRARGRVCAQASP